MSRFTSFSLLQTQILEDIKKKKRRSSVDPPKGMGWDDFAKPSLDKNTLE
jgi:hypothetical protein